MTFYIKRLIFIIILSSISNISLSHEFWIDPKNYHLSNNEKAIANIFIGENFEGFDKSKIGQSYENVDKKYKVKFERLIQKYGIYSFYH